MKKWFSQIKESLCKSLESESAGVVVKDFEVSALAVSTLLDSGVTAKSVLVVTPDLTMAEQLYSDLGRWRDVWAPGDSKLRFFPESSYRSGVDVFQATENNAQRCLVLQGLVNGSQEVVVASADAAVGDMMSPNEFSSKTMTLRVNESGYDPADLARRFLELDYDNEFEVHTPGEYALRGGIVDIYSPLYEFPARIEFFGDEIDSIRFFNPKTQRSVERVDELLISPASDMLWDEAGEVVGDSATLFDYLGDDSLVLVLFPSLIEAQLDKFYDASKSGEFREAIGGQSVFTIFTEDGALGQEVMPLFGAFSLTPIFHAKQNLDDIYQAMHGKLLKEQLLRWGNNYQISAALSEESEEKRFREMLAEDEKLKGLDVNFIRQKLPCGFMIPGERQIVLTDHEIFALSQSVDRKRLGAKVRNYQSDWSIRDDVDLWPGDNVVHLNYGIAEFLGIDVMDSGGERKEVMILEFADEIKVYVPLTQAHLISRYVGQGKGGVKLSRVGGVSWGKAKEAAEESIRDFAAELLRLQAARTTLNSTSCFGDEEMQEAFEALFPFDPTPDQLTAIQDIKNDMEEKAPMDRLLCGDVGYGKTEVAMRAAFKAVMNGRQVAVIAPTTILAQQHFMTFSERMSAFPVTMDLLCRFKTPAQQKASLKQVQGGQTDIIIGTHRLLQGDLNFSDLGLVVIDEEQKFGVKHKERLKMLRVEVDILTMSATPIPRTLYMSLAGARDLSTINTPPTQRQAVKTVVSKFDDNLVAEAIRRELERQGQVFFLHNRVQSIQKFAAKIQKLVPAARIAFAHGRMGPHDLEEIMIRFQNHEIDVLVSTTIIENGVDIPNANTIIIDRADRFGLAELYQLRGRVGRSHRQAYAYLLIPPQQILTHTARERIAAIKKYTHLGAGFKLALRDLEIRGAGNILGAKQSGHIAAIGFELYCDLLKDAVERMKNIPLEARRKLDQCVVKLDFIRFRTATAKEDKEDQVLSTGIPQKYINAENIRIECYKRLAVLKNPKELREFGKELEDRFGKAPACVKNLLSLRKVEVLAGQRKIHSITMRGLKLYLETSKGLVKIAGRLPSLVASTPKKMLAQLTSLLENL